MPLPLAPILMRLGVAALAGYAAGRISRRAAGLHPGRTDQRAEDALDELDEGLSFHSPADRCRSEPETRQSNAAFRLRRTFGFRGRQWDVDAGLIARLRLKQRLP